MKPRSMSKRMMWVGLPAIFAMATPEAWGANAYLRFQLKVTPTRANVDAHIAHIPSLELLVAPALSIPADAAEQLSIAVETAASRLVDGAMLEPITLPADWKLVVNSEPRSANEPLVGAFYSKLIDCYHAVDPSRSVELNSLWLVLRGSAQSERSVAEANIAGQLMADSYSSNGCTQAVNAKPIDSITSQYITSDVRGMLTEQWDQSFVMGSGNILRVVDALSPLFFGTDGMWVHQKLAGIRYVVTSALKNGLPSEAVFEALSQQEFETFDDFVRETRREVPGVVQAFFDTAKTACVSGLGRSEHEPFLLEECLDWGALRTVRFKIGDVAAVSITGGAQP